MKRNKALKYAIAWMDHENNMLSEREPVTNTIYCMFPFTQKARIRKSSESGGRLVSGDQCGSYCQWVQSFLLGWLKLAKVVFSHICECTENHGLVCFKWMNYMIRELYLNKSDKKQVLLGARGSWRGDALTEGHMGVKQDGFRKGKNHSLRNAVKSWHAHAWHWNVSHPGWSLEHPPTSSGAISPLESHTWYEWMST